VKIKTDEQAGRARDAGFQEAAAIYFLCVETHVQPPADRMAAIRLCQRVE
jgi:hypothetical protein